MIDDKTIKEAVALRERVAWVIDATDHRLHPMFESDAVNAITQVLIVADALDSLGINIECGGDG